MKILNFNNWLNESNLSDIEWTYNDIWKGSLYDDGQHASGDIVFSGYPEIKKIHNFGAPVPPKEWKENIKLSIFTITVDGTKIALAFLKNGEVYSWYQGDEKWLKKDKKWDASDLSSCIYFIKDIYRNKDNNFNFTGLITKLSKLEKNKNIYNKYLNSKNNKITKLINNFFQKDTYLIEIQSFEIKNPHLGIRLILNEFPNAKILFFGKDITETLENDGVYTGYVVNIPETSVKEIQKKNEEFHVSKIQELEPETLFDILGIYGLNLNSKLKRFLVS